MRRLIDESPTDLRDLLKVCLSSVLRRVSWQDEADLRVRKRIHEYQAGEASAAFQASIKAAAVRLIPYLEVLSACNPSHFTVVEDDAASLTGVQRVLERGVDLVVTSPPYATALPYLDTDRLSLIVLGLLPRSAHKDREAQMIGTREISESRRQREWESFLDRRDELPTDVVQLIEEVAAANHRDGIGFRRRNLPALLSRYYLAMRESLGATRRLMKNGGFGFYIVGSNSTRVDGRRIDIPTERFLAQIAVEAGWQHVESIPMELARSRDIFRENRGSREAILVLKAEGAQ